MDYNNLKGGRDSSVGIATRYGLDGQGIESQWRRDFPHPSRPALRPTQPPVQWVPGLSRGVKRPGRRADAPPNLQYRSLKLGRAIPLPALRAVVACIGRTFFKLYMIITEQPLVITTCTHVTNILNPTKRTARLYCS